VPQWTGAWVRAGLHPAGTLPLSCNAAVGSSGSTNASDHTTVNLGTRRCAAAHHALCARF
jgi:hypothetical protein